MFVLADLSLVLTREAMVPVLANAEVQQRLIPLLPEAAELPKTEAELRATMNSPQFQQVQTNHNLYLDCVINKSQSLLGPCD